MKPGSNMQLSKKSLAEELAGRLQGQFMSGKFEVGEKLPPERRTAHDAAVLEKHLAERGATAAAGALQACIEADVNFHIALAEATHNEILCELYRSTAAHLKKRFSNIYRDTECLLATQPTHGQLLGYILAGDVRNAREAITRILEEP